MLVSACLALSLAFVSPASSVAASADERSASAVSAVITMVKAAATPTKWTKLLEKYRTKKRVNQLVFVKCKGYTCTVVLYSKLLVGSSETSAEPTWKRVLTCKGHIGRNGLGKKREGDMKTPKGTYSILTGYGIEKNPGTALPYFKVNRHLYWCGDKKWYNTLVDVRKQKHACSGEHLIAYKGWYDYGLVFDYNMNPVVWKKGSALFMHCSNGDAYSHGCIAIAKKNMKTVLRELQSGAKICIYAR